MWLISLTIIIKFIVKIHSLLEDAPDNIIINLHCSCFQTLHVEDSSLQGTMI